MDYTDLVINRMLSAYLPKESPAQVAPEKSANLAQGVSIPNVRGRKVRAVVNDATAVAIAAPIAIVKIDAVTFTSRMQSAGYRNGVFDHSLERSDKIAAIEAFVGFDSKGNFGSQELNAISKASFEIRQARGERSTAPSRAEVRRFNANLSGFVAGMPDRAGVRQNNFLARERLAVDAIIEHEHASMVATNDQDRSVSRMLANAERERLEHIRADLNSGE